MNFRELPNQRSPANLISAHRRLGNACGRLTKLKGIQPEGLDEMVRLAAALEDAHSRNVDGTLFAVVQIARLSGDRLRDLDLDLRSRALDALRTRGSPDFWQRLLLEVVAIETVDQARAFAIRYRPAWQPEATADRKSVVEGKRGDVGGRRV